MVWKSALSARFLLFVPARSIAARTVARLSPITHQPEPIQSHTAGFPFAFATCRSPSFDQLSPGIVLERRILAAEAGVIPKRSLPHVRKESWPGGFSASGIEPLTIS